MGYKLKHISAGFTLVEILMAVVILGIAIVALVVSNVAFTQQTSQADQLSTAEFLIEQIREMTAAMPVKDANQTSVYDFDGTVFNPPVDNRQRQLAHFSEYSQSILVQNVSTTNFQQVVADNTSHFVRVTVNILYGGSSISQAKWVRTIQ